MSGGVTGDDVGAFFAGRKADEEDSAEALSLEALAEGPPTPPSPPRRRPSRRLLGAVDPRELSDEAWGEVTGAWIELARLVEFGNDTPAAVDLGPSKYPAYVTRETDNTVRQLLIEAEQHMLDGDYEAACERFEAALEVRFDQVETLKRLAELAARQGDATRHSRCYGSLFQLATEPAERAHYLVKAAQATPLEADGGLSPKSLKALTMALSLDPTNTSAFEALCEHHGRRGDWHRVALLHQDRIQSLSARSGRGAEVVATWKSFAKALDKSGQKEQAKVAHARFKELRKALKKRR